MNSKTIKQVIQEGANYLAKKGNLDAPKEAEKIIAFGLDLKRVDIYLNYEKPLSENELIRLRKLFQERASSKPLQYIIGEVDFRYIKLKVNESVLIPRFETEMMIDVAKNLLKQTSKVLDLGTGSGAIAISVAKECKCSVDAGDVSLDALKVATENAKLNNIEDINWINSSWFEKINDKYDLIISNPPYISLSDYNNLAPEIKNWEPKNAVTDNDNGLKCIQEIADNCINYLNIDGYIILEIGYDQKDLVQNILEKAGFNHIAFEKDLAGMFRFVSAKRS